LGSALAKKPGRELVSLAGFGAEPLGLQSANFAAEKNYAAQNCVIMRGRNIHKK
jgi:hypothetical protein